MIEDQQNQSSEGNKFSLRKTAYNILRPETSRDLIEHRKSNLIESSAMGAVYGAGFFSLFKIMEIKIEHFNSGMSLPPQNMANDVLLSVVNHPLEVILTGSLIGLGIKAYPMLFHRPLPPENH